ncbi:TadE-like protein [bacterium BMS3Abin02]|nr:TadE-like protein [bacterium BMS3Abin02]
MKDERGATLVEFAIISILLFTVLYGIMEFSLAFKDWLSISHASREGVRVGAVAGNDAAADIEILRAVERAMTAAGMTNLVSVSVANPDNMSEKTAYAWNGGTPCRWTPCPDPTEPAYVQPGWDPGSRRISTPTDRIEVSIEFRHQWVTGLFSIGPTDWKKTVIMDIEPQVFG